MEQREICGYNIVKKLNKEQFGTVYRVIDSKGNNYALKIFNPYEDYIDYNEIAILSSFNSDYMISSLRIISTFDCVSPSLKIYENNYAIIQPLSSGSLQDLHLRDIKDVKEENTIQICRALYDSLLGLQDMHNSGALHLDIKPENILLFSDELEKERSKERSKEREREKPSLLRAKLADFGLSAIVYDSNENHNIDPCYTPYYRPYESEYLFYVNAKSDIYALGITFLVICTSNINSLVESFSKERNERLRIGIQQINERKALAIKEGISIVKVDEIEKFEKASLNEREYYSNYFLQICNQQSNPIFRVIERMIQTRDRDRSSIEEIKNSSLFELIKKTASFFYFTPTNKLSFVPNTNFMFLAPYYEESIRYSLALDLFYRYLSVNPKTEIGSEKNRKEIESGSIEEIDIETPLNYYYLMRVCCLLARNITRNLSYHGPYIDNIDISYDVYDKVLRSVNYVPYRKSLISIVKRENFKTVIDACKENSALYIDYLNY
jgi:serine/threonine protein kinase